MLLKWPCSGGIEVESNEDVMVNEEDYDDMMEALTNIQEKGDNMMAGIWWQKDILDKLETSLEEAETKMVAAEERNEALDNIKEDLETEVSNLEKRREELIVKMSEEEQHMQRYFISSEMKQIPDNYIPGPAQSWLHSNTNCHRENLSWIS